MREYHGIVIRESLRNSNIIGPPHFKVLGSKYNLEKSWALYLVEISAGRLNDGIRILQKNMKNGYYAHFYRYPELRVIFPEKEFVVHVVSDRAKWAEFIEYGVRSGVPREQLECKPVREEDEKDWLER